MKPKSRSNSGAVLIITLVFLVLIAIFIVGAANLMSLNRSATHTHFEKVRAAMFADSGVQQVVATLQQTTSDPNRYWVSQPGLLWAGNPTDDPTTPTDDRLILSNSPLPLSSPLPSASAPTDPTLAPCNLNVPTLADSTEYLISNDQDASGSVVKMNVDWVYVRSSGTLDTNEAPNTANTTDPIVGRYAYWTDDESSRVNCNLAWGGRSGSNTNAVTSPTLIDLTALTNVTTTLASQIHQFVTPNNYQTIGSLFNTPEDTHRVNTNVAGVLDTNRFEVTHYNSDPNLGMFYGSATNSDYYQGHPILLTTNPNLVPKNADGSYAYRFLDIRTGTGALDPGYQANIDSTKLATTLQMLLDSFASTNWPMTGGSGSSFRQKYYSYDTSNTRYFQLALNLVDYVRCRESTNAIVTPLRALWTPPATVNSFDCKYADIGLFTDQNSFIGLGRGPCVTEIGIWVADTASPPTGTPPAPSSYQARFVVELYLPPNYGLASVDLTKLAVLVQYRNETPGDVDGESQRQGAPGVAAPNDATASTNTLMAGQYATFTSGTFYLTAGTVRPSTLKVRVNTIPQNFNPGADKLENVPVGRIGTTDTATDNTLEIPVPIDPVGTAISNITSVEVDDPRVNKNKNNWIPHVVGSSPHNTFGGPNTILSVGKAATAVVPQQDTDSSGNISAAGLYMPPPKGTKYTRPDGTVDDNTLGMMTSVAELGYLPTGNESSPQITPQGGVPWRTLRLQPSTQPASVVPDWALMGLFAVPTVPPSAGQCVFAPHTNSIGGRINVNALCQPFNFVRGGPLAGVFQGAQNEIGNASSSFVSSSSAQTMASNIASHTLAANGKNYGLTNAYYFPGEIAEIAGVADQGEASEEVLRQTVDLLTVRGNVYGVYSVGQAIQQTQGGTLKVTGEQRVHAIVERWVDGTGGTSSNPGTLKFKVLYYGALSR